jgi:NADP-dependent 3-hydroxy acid dehydrogenase YdfG
VSPTAAPLSGNVALVTGASRGIGQAIATALYEAGAHIVRLARSLADGSTDRQTDLRCDVTDAGSVERALGLVREALGVPHIVVNNAGVFFVKAIEATSPAEFTATLAANLTGPFLVARSLVPEMRERGGGHFVTVGSIADHVGFAGSAAYAASKFGLRGMHDVIVAELSNSGVRTTLVSPGPVDTEIWDPIDPDRRAGFTKRRDMLHPTDVAAAVLFAVTQPARVNVSEIRVMPNGYQPR